MTKNCSGPRDENASYLQTTMASLDVLVTLEDLSGARLTTLADELKMPPSTLHGHLASLRQRDFVVKEGNVYYRGPELLRLGHYVRTRKDGYCLADTYVNRIYEQTTHRTIFVALQGGRGVFLHMKSGDRSEWRHEAIGNRLYLHDTAVGKAMLAKMPNRRIEAILDLWRMPRETDNTITSRDELWECIEAIRDRGYAINRGENIPRLHALGVAAQDTEGTVIGGFSVSGPEVIVSDGGLREEIVDTLHRQVEEYELELSLKE